MIKLAQKLLQDLITYLLTMGPLCLALGILLALMSAVEIGAYAWVILAPLVLIASFLLSLFVFRCCLPKLKKGVYKVGFNKGFLTWYMHSMLSRSARVTNLHYFLNCFSITRFLYWRAMGAKVSFYMDTSYKIVVHDFPLIEVGAGSLLAEDVELSGHLITGDRLLVAPVKIGKNVFVGRTTYIGPKTSIGDGSWIGMGHYIHGKTIEPSTKMESLK